MFVFLISWRLRLEMDPVTMRPYRLGSGGSASYSSEFHSMSGIGVLFGLFPRVWMYVHVSNTIAYSGLMVSAKLSKSSISCRLCPIVLFEFEGM